MDVDLIFKIAAIGILVAVLNQLLVRSGREEQAMMVGMGTNVTDLTNRKSAQKGLRGVKIDMTGMVNPTLFSWRPVLVRRRTPLWYFRPAYETD